MFKYGILYCLNINFTVIISYKFVVAYNKRILLNKTVGKQPAVESCLRPF
jgi:hypothetical protein